MNGCFDMFWMLDKSSTNSGIVHGHLDRFPDGDKNRPTELERQKILRIVIRYVSMWFTAWKRLYPKHLWALAARGRDLIGRGRTPRASERGVGALVQIETRGREGSRGVMRGRDVPRVLGRWVSKCDIVCFTYLLVVVCCSQFWYVPVCVR